MGRYLSIEAGDGRVFRAFYAAPATTPAAGLLVLQEIFGLNANIRQIVEDFAAAGFVTMAPDLFWRQEPNVDLDPSQADDRDHARRLLSGLDEGLAVEDCAAAAANLRVSPACTGKVGAVGFCVGGKLAYLAASRSFVDASVSYYGVGIHAALDEAAIGAAPQLLHIAGADALCPPGAQAAIAKAAAATGNRIRVVVHPGAGHAFARRGGEAYQAETAHAADRETLAFLREGLAAPRA